MNNHSFPQPKNYKFFNHKLNQVMLVFKLKSNDAGRFQDKKSLDMPMSIGEL